MAKINVNNIKEKALAAKDKAVDAVAKGGEHEKNQAIKAKQDIDKMICKPLLPSDIEHATFVLPSLIHVTDDDPKTQKEACKGAVAFDEGNGEKKALTVLTEYAEKLPVTFYPNLKEGIYYVDPYRKDYYIDLNDYFQYFKNAKVHELNEIAQDLGATYIKISVAAEKRFSLKKGQKQELV